jgi:DNA-binding SARP family transcriptional activator
VLESRHGRTVGDRGFPAAAARLQGGKTLWRAVKRTDTFGERLVPIQFQILGPFTVTGDDGRTLDLRGAKPAALLAMLALRPNELVAADRLIEDLWEGQPPASAPKTLQVHVSRLRRALPGELIATAGGGYLLRAEPDQVDAQRFERLVGEGTAALSEGAWARASSRLRSGLSLWRGDVLADFAYASFAQDAIARLDGLRTVALESAVEAELALGRHAELIPEIKALVKRHPLSEHLHAQLMLALYRSGRQAEALGVYRAARRVLVDQLGIEPSEELRELERQILEQDDALAAPTAQARPQREQVEKSQRGALVGYENELGALEDLLEQAIVRNGRLALIAGEPGVGKTRLADELSTVASTRGAGVVWGRAWSGGGAPAFWPWIQVLRALVADRDAVTVRSELGPSAAELMQLLPELRDIVPGLEAVDHADVEEGRFRLFDAAATFVTRAAANRPLVIVLDDLHDADQSTLALLQFMATATLDAPVLIVGTYRDTDAALARPLSDALSELARTTDCLQLVLTGLSGDDTAHFVELSAGVAPMPMLATAIHDASSGNPLFVTELVRLLRAEDRLHELGGDDPLALPHGIEQVIARRLEHLSDACRRTLALAAVIGREFDVALLERAAETSVDELLAHLDDARAARVIEETPGLRFSHDLVRHTLYAGLARGERRRMHEAVALALESRNAARPEAVADALGHHFAEALPGADAAKAVHYLTLAGDAAGDINASHEAATLYSRAAEIAKASGSGADVLCDLYLKLAERLVEAFDMAGAKTAVEEAQSLIASAPDRVLESRLVVARAHLRMLDALALEDEEVFDAIALFEEIGDPVGAARGWGALVILNCGRSDRLKGDEAAEHMLDCARRAGSKPLLSQAMRSIGSALALGAAPISEAIPRLRVLFDEADDAMTRGRLLNCIATLEAMRGRFDESRALAAEALELVPPGRRFELEGYVYSTGTRTEYLAGNFRRAEELARADNVHLETQGLVRYMSSELTFLVDALIAQGKLEEAAAQLERAAPLAAPDDVDALLRQARSHARLEFARADVETAESFARQALSYMDQAMAPDEHAESLLLLSAILTAAGRDAEARDVAADAFGVAEAREHSVFMQRARELMGAAAPVAAAD